MRSKTSTWFEVKVRYQRTMDDGMERFVTELYVVDALTFTECEKQITIEVGSMLDPDKEFSVIAEKIAPYKEIFFSDKDGDDMYYRCTLDFITIDERTQKEKRSKVCYLVQASSLESARKYIDEAMGKTMIDYVIKSVVETKILDTFEHFEKKADGE